MASGCRPGGPGPFHVGQRTTAPGEATTCAAVMDVGTATHMAPSAPTIGRSNHLRKRPCETPTRGLNERRIGSSTPVIMNCAAGTADQPLAANSAPISLRPHKVGEVHIKGIHQKAAGWSAMADGAYRGNPGVIIRYRKPADGAELPEWKADLNTQRRIVRAQVEHVLTRRSPK